MLLLTLFSLTAFATDQEMCGVIKSYQPPQNQSQPHRVAMRNIDLIFWPEDLKSLELYPWNLVEKEMCVSGIIKHTMQFKPAMTIRKSSQIRIIK